MSLVTRRMRKHAYQLERRATDFPRKFCRATKFPSDRISCDTGVTVICVSPGYTCPRTYHIPRETRSREHISLKLHFLSVTVIYVFLRCVPSDQRHKRPAGWLGLGGMMLYCITSPPLALAIRRAACVASHTAHAEACLSVVQACLSAASLVTKARAV